MAKTPRKFRFRVLPLVIFAAAMMLSVRVYDAVTLIQEGELPIGVSQLDAATPPTTGTSSQEVFDPLSLSAEEVRVLESLHEKKLALEKKERAFDERKILLTTLEDRINKKIAELKTLKEKMEEIVKTHDENENAKLDKLVQVYGKMKPKDAGIILSELDFETLMGVVSRMDASKIAPIFAKMDPDVTRILTAELARRQNITDEAHQKLSEANPSSPS